MSAILEDPAKAAPTEPSPRNSSVPLLSESKAEAPDNEGPKQGANSKTGSMRKLFGLGKKKEGDKATETKNLPPSSVPALSGNHSRPAALRPASPLQSNSSDQKQSTVQDSPRMHPAMASPSRRYRSSSPRMHSPASSQIFERNVQENVVPGELSPAIPSHIQTEDYIPPVLEASSLAITDDHLNPDEVEIVMHSAHLPAAAAVTGSMTDSTIVSPAQEEFGLHQDIDDSASNYGSLDNTDIRRLSFISFADVVQAEHAENNRDAMHLMSYSSTTNRSPSPVRSPASSHGMSVSPPTSQATSVKGLEAASPKYSRTPGSPIAAQGTHSPPLGSELQIETMRQALRKTGSGDLSSARSQPLSAVSMEDGSADQSPFK